MNIYNYTESASTLGFLVDWEWTLTNFAMFF